MKSGVSATASLGNFDGHYGPLDRPLGVVLESHRRALIISGLLSLLLMIFAAGALGWLPSSVRPSPGPLSGTWGCSLAGEPVGNLSVDGWKYVLGPNDAGEQSVGTLEIVVYPGKYREEFVKVQGGTLSEKFGIRLGFHVPKPELLVFNIGPGSGIRCTRM